MPRHLLSQRQSRPSPSSLLSSPQLGVSRNFFDREWEGDRRLKNVSMLLEFVPSRGKLEPRPTPALSSLSSEQRGSLTSTVYLLGYPGMTMPLIVTSIGSALTISTALVMITVVAAVATVFVFFAGTRSGALTVGNANG